MYVAVKFNDVCVRMRDQWLSAFAKCAGQFHGVGREIDGMLSLIVQYQPLCACHLLAGF